MPQEIEESAPFNKNLPVELTDAEKAKKGKEAGKLQAKVDATRQKMNDATAGHKKDLKEMGGKLHVLLSELENGTEERPVPCVEKRNFNTKKATVVRTDTGAEVDHRTLSPEEMQRQMPGTDGNVISDVPDEKPKKARKGKKA